MYYIIQINDNQYLKLTHTKYYNTVDIVSDFNLATVFNTAQEASRTYYKYIDDMRNNLNYTDHIFIREVSIQLSSNYTELPNLLDY